MEALFGSVQETLSMAFRRIGSVAGKLPPTSSAMADETPPSAERYRAPHISDGPCNFVIANDGTKDCIALLITREMIAPFQNSSNTDCIDLTFRIDRRDFEDADLIPYHDALEYPESLDSESSYQYAESEQDDQSTESEHSYQSARSQQSDSSLISSGKLLRRAVYEKYRRTERALWDAEYDFDVVQDAYSDALDEWQEGHTKWTRSLDTRSAFDKAILHDKMLATTQLMDDEETFELARAEADKHGMLDDIDRHSLFFNPDCDYRRYDPVFEGPVRMDPVDKRRIEDWVEEVGEGCPAIESRDLEIDEWYAGPVKFGESLSVIDCEGMQITGWAQAREALRKEIGFETQREDLPWELDSTEIPRRHSWSGVMV